MSDPADPATLSELVAQRLCHDIVNPLGAVGIGLELLAETQGKTPEMALMQDSLGQALGRIKLYRLAFGAAGEGGTMTADDLGAALQALGGARPIALTLDLGAVPMPRSLGRLAALLALCAERALAWGGTLRLSVRDDRLALAAAAPRLRADPEAWADLAAGRAPDPCPPPMVQFALAARAAQAAGRQVTVALAPGAIDLTA